MVYSSNEERGGSATVVFALRGTCNIIKTRPCYLQEWDSPGKKNLTEEGSKTSHAGLFFLFLL